MLKAHKKLLTIHMDHREDRSGMGDLLAQQKHIQLIRSHLSVGDYIINEVVVAERKTGLDFVQSIVDGRLFRQASRMKSIFRSSVFIIEGNNLYRSGINIHPHAVKGALANLGLVWQIPVLFTDDPCDTVMTLMLIANQSMGVYNEFSYRPGRRPKQLRKRQLYILQGLPYVGNRLARYLLDHFGSVQAAMNASKEDLMRIPCLGQTKAKKIRQVLSK